MDQPIIHLHWSGKYNNVMLVLRYKWKLWLQLSLGILNKSESCWQYYTALPVSELAISKWEQKKLHRLPRLSHSSNTVCISSIKSWRWSLNRVHWSRKCSTSSTPSPQLQLLDTSTPILCWWAFSKGLLECLSSDTAQNLTVEYCRTPFVCMSAGNNWINWIQTTDKTSASCKVR